MAVRRGRGRALWARHLGFDEDFIIGTRNPNFKETPELFVDVLPKEKSSPVEKINVENVREQVQPVIKAEPDIAAKASEPKLTKEMEAEESKPKLSQDVRVLSQDVRVLSQDIRVKISESILSQDIRDKVSEPKRNEDVVDKASASPPKLNADIETTAAPPKLNADIETTATPPKSNADIETTVSAPKLNADIETTASKSKSKDDILSKASSPKLDGDIETTALKSKLTDDILPKASSPKLNGDTETKASKPKWNNNVKPKKSISQLDEEREAKVLEPTRPEAPAADSQNDEDINKKIESITQLFEKQAALGFRRIDFGKTLQYPVVQDDIPLSPFQPGSENKASNVKEPKGDQKPVLTSFRFGKASPVYQGFIGSDGRMKLYSIGETIISSKHLMASAAKPVTNSSKVTLTPPELFSSEQLPVGRDHTATPSFMLNAARNQRSPSPIFIPCNIDFHGNDKNDLEYCKKFEEDQDLGLPRYRAPVFTRLQPINIQQQIETNTYEGPGLPKKGRKAGRGGSRAGRVGKPYDGPKSQGESSGQKNESSWPEEEIGSHAGSIKESQGGLPDESRSGSWDEKPRRGARKESGSGSGVREERSGRCRRR